MLINVGIYNIFQNITHLTPLTQSLWTEILEFKARTLSTPSIVSIFWSNFQVLILPVQSPKIKKKKQNFELLFQTKNTIYKDSQYQLLNNESIWNIVY